MTSRKLPTQVILRRLEERGLLDVARNVAIAHHVAVGDVLGRRRSRSVVLARHALFVELAARTFMSGAEIALLLDRDPTTVNGNIKNLTKGAP